MISAERAACAAALALAAAGCELGRERPTQPVLGTLEVRSDPTGAAIRLDGRATGLQTPATLTPAAGTHRLRLDFVSVAGEGFAWEADVVVPETAAAVVDAALIGGCFANCPFRLAANRVGCIVTGMGDLCSTVFNPGRRGQNAWPLESGNELVAGLRLQVAAVVGPDGGVFAGDTVASHVYDGAWIGRSPVSERRGAGAQAFSVRTWADPGATVGALPLVGIAVEQEAIAPTSGAFPDLRDVLYVRFRIRNVTDDPRFRDWHPELPPGGLTYTALYAGLALDADVGEPSDDAGTFLPDPGVAFVYDLDFQDAQLGGGFASAPPLVGVVWVEPPATAARRPFSLWRIDDDWDGPTVGLGDDRPGFGYRVLSAQLAPGDPLPDCTGPGDEVGFCADDPRDYRLSLTAGPLELAPGEEAGFALALVFAEPVPGTFASGTAIRPGIPGQNPAVALVADSLAARARRAVARWPDVAQEVGP